MTDLDAAIRSWATPYPWLGYVLIAVVLVWALWQASVSWRLRWRNRRTRNAFAARETRHWQGHRLTPPAPARSGRRARHVAAALLFVVLIGLGLYLARHATGQDTDTPVLVGTVIKVTDGDTINVQLSSGPITVRLDSIDTPERNQPWGKQATAALKERLDGQEVALEVVTQDRYERLVAVVYRGDEDASLNLWMVEQGHAWVYRQYARDPRYCEVEDAARAARRGLWSRQGEAPIAPWEWRQLERDRLEFVTDYQNETAARCKASLGQRPTRGSTTLPSPTTAREPL